MNINLNVVKASLVLGVKKPNQEPISTINLNLAKNLDNTIF